MSKRFAPFVLVDDNVDQTLPPLVHALGADAVIGIDYPADFDSGSSSNTLGKIRRASVLLVDHNLMDTKRDHGPLEPLTGSGLLAALPGIAAGHNDSDPATQPFRLRADVIYSGKLDQLASVDLRPGVHSMAAPVLGREHVVARMNNVDWVLSKSRKDRPPPQEDLAVLSELAAAVATALRNRKIGTESPETALRKLMKLSLRGWGGRAVEQIEDMHPPLQAIASGDALAAIRWLLHIALPFPGCLHELRDVALALRLDPAWLRSNDKALLSLSGHIAAAAYSGALSAFQGKRWWKAGIDALIWEKTEGRFYDQPVLRSLAKSLTGDSDAKTIDLATPVLVVDEDFRRTDVVAELDKCVQVQPDDWPPSVEFPWIEIDRVQRSPRLLSLVVPKDSARVE